MGPQTTLDRPENPRNTPKPILSGRRSFGEMLTIRVFPLIPFYTLGVTVGYHRYFTHGAFSVLLPANHADPTSARHGVLRGQIDVSARLIRLFERFGWAWQVRWPTPRRLARLAVR